MPPRAKHWFTAINKTGSFFAYYLEIIRWKSGTARVNVTTTNTPTQPARAGWCLGWDLPAFAGHPANAGWCCNYTLCANLL